MKAEIKDSYTFDELRAIVAELRRKCPWDRIQTFESLKECLVSEAEEVCEAVDNDDRENLCEELGDVLLQVMLNSCIAEEEGSFTFDDVITGLARKLVRRHPHVFGGKKAETPEEALALWREAKRQEREQKNGFLP